MKKLIAIALFAMAAAPAALAGTPANGPTGTASAGATIVSPLTLTSTSNLYFGTIAPSIYQSDSAVVTAAGAFTCGKALSCLSSDQTAAAFTVTGYQGASYSVAIPSSIQIADAAGDTMTVDKFSLDKGQGTLTNGADTFHVGGQLTVGQNQKAGVYTGVFTVSANYQ